MKNYLIIKLLISVIIIYILGYFLIGQTNLLSIQTKNIVPDKVKNLLKKTIYKNKYKKIENEKNKLISKIVKNEILAGYIDFEEKDSGLINDHGFYFKGYYLPYASPYLANKKKSFLLNDQEYSWVILKSGKIIKFENETLDFDVIPKIEIKSNLYKNFVNNEKQLYDGIIAADLENDEIWLLTLKTEIQCQNLKIIKSSNNNLLLNFINFKELELPCGKISKNFNSKIKRLNNKIIIQLNSSIYIIDIITKNLIKKININSLKEVLLINENYIYFKNDEKKIKYFNFENNKIENISVYLYSEKNDINQKIDEGIKSHGRSWKYKGSVNFSIPDKNIIQFIKLHNNNASIIEEINFNKLHNKIKISSIIQLSPKEFLITTLENPRIIKFVFDKTYK